MWIEKVMEKRIEKAKENRRLYCANGKHALTFGITWHDKNSRYYITRHCIDCDHQEVTSIDKNAHKKQHWCKYIYNAVLSVKILLREMFKINIR